MGLMNGLSQMGAGLAQYAGTAGLESQKADLAKQAMTLADQLAGARESAGRQEAGAIAATAAEKANAFQAGEGVLNRQSQQTVAGIGAGATLASTRMQIDANAGLRAAQEADANARTDLTRAQTVKVDAVTGIQQRIADEYANPTPDQEKIKSLTNQVVAFSTDAASQAAIGTSLASMAASAQQQLSRLTAQRDTELTALNGIQYDDELKAQKQAAVNDLNQQIRATQLRADSYTSQAGAFTANRANLPGAGAAVPGGAGLINGGPASPTTPGKEGAASPAATPDQPPAAAAAAAPAVRLPGAVGNATNLDVLKAARPDLNLEPLKGKSPMVVGLMMQVIDGRATLPPLGSRSPDALMIRALASEIDPTLDEASSKGRMATRVAFTSGPEARNITALNTALGHAGVVADAFDKLGNFGNKPTNYVWNEIAQQLGSEKYSNASVAVGALASEARKVFAGGTGGGGLTELENWEKSFPINGSPSQQRGALQQFVTLLDSRLQSLGDQYNRGMGVTGDPMSFLEPHARAAFTKLSGAAPDEPTGRQLGNPRGAAASAAAPTPKPAVASPAGAIPSWVKPGDEYSASRNQARSSTGVVYGEPQ